MGSSRCLERVPRRTTTMMAAAYGTAVIEERLKPRRHAELAAYVRREYGPYVGPEFLLAEIANGGAWGPRGRRRAELSGVLTSLAKAMKVLIVGNGRKAKIPDAAR
jgi:hypothetical protein